MQKTTMLKKEQADSRKQWFLINADGLVLGRLAVLVANILRGKNKVDYTPNVDGGDFVVITNASKIVLTGNKLEGENWYNHSHYIGGLRTRSGKEMVSKYSPELIYRAVKGMLPKNKLARKMITKLFIYADEEHKHQAQMPITLDLSNKKGK
ncbi:50S ribosomal protein L13 [Ureaplasma canigenitalium]|uniref:50S ribosomal protein L13 n=1 Tax=Ureaplasma canigenitalium TaxID=42092 RepID=UPI0004E15FF6|nr:50S ribosomal protein L13 [Ureaplasma canigenitalium]